VFALPGGEVFATASGGLLLLGLAVVGEGILEIDVQRLAPALEARNASSPGGVSRRSGRHGGTHAGRACSALSSSAAFSAAASSRVWKFLRIRTPWSHPELSRT